MPNKDSCDKKKTMEYSTNLKRIPFKHIDQINIAVKKLAKIDVKLSNDFKCNMFSIDGQFPTFVSSINHDYENVRNVDIKVGDYIIIINNQNVSRASAKTVRKIIKSSSALNMTLYRPDEKILNKVLFNAKNKQNSNKLIDLIKRNISSQQKKIKYFMSCMPKIPIQHNHQKDTVVKNINNQMIQSLYSELKRNEETLDYGYYSIPRTDFTSSSQTISSSSSISSLYSTSITTASTEFNIQITNTKSGSSIGSNMRKETGRDIHFAIDNFLKNMQCLIDIYVRPSVAFKILSTEQCFALFQNVEKLIPVTRFLLNILSSSSDRLPNAESMKIAFDAFKTYLVGLPNAIKLLDNLAMKNEKFALFLEELNDEKQLKIFDLLFVPFGLVQTLIESTSLMLKFNTEDSFNSMQLKQIVQDLFECSIKVNENLDDLYEAKKMNCDSITNISDCSDFYSSSFDSQEDIDNNQFSDVQAKNCQFDFSYDYYH